MAKESPQNQTYPFRVFISHKVSGHGGAAEAIKRELEIYAKDKLKIFVSPALSPGVKWRPEVLQEIEGADLFILLYLVEGIEMDWCLYEAGYFAREARQTGRKLICVINPEHSLPGPLEDRQRLEATKPGVEELLRVIYADEHKPVRPDLFDRTNDKFLKQLIDFILNALQPVKREPLSPRLWITLSGDEAVEQLKKDMFVADAHLAGESEALRQFGVGPGAGISLADFYARSEFKRTLDLYIPHLNNCLRRIVEGETDLWIIPPVRLVKDGQPKVLVPAYMEKGLGNKYKFEFVVYQPQPDYDPNAESAFDALYNFFYLGWRFRTRIIEEWLETLIELHSLGPRAETEDIRRKVRKFKLAFRSILLEALNRNLDSPRRVEKYFHRKEDQEKLQKIMNLENGSYITCAGQLYQAIEANNLETIIECLRQFRNINKTLLVMSTVRLQELVLEMSGDLV
jgi:hypothetical protein